MLSPYKPLGFLPDPLQKQLQDHKRAQQGRGDPQKLFKRFNQVLAWSQATLETAEEERLLRRQRKQKARSREPKREEATAQSRIKDLAEMGKAGVVDAAATYQDWKQQRKARREKMDRAVGAAPPPPPVRTAKAVLAQAKKESAKVKDEMPEVPIKWPKLKVEPWLEDLIDSSKFF